MENHSLLSGSRRREQPLPDVVAIDDRDKPTNVSLGRAGAVVYSVGSAITPSPVPTRRQAAGRATEFTLEGGHRELAHTAQHGTRRKRG